MEKFMMVQVEKGVILPDPDKNFEPIAQGIPVKVKICAYWNRRVKHGDVKLIKADEKQE